MNAKFSVGETVIRQSPFYPEGNGEYTIIGLIDCATMQLLHPKMNVGNNIFYHLEGFKVKLPSGSVANHSAEIFLKKKHQRSEFTFNSLMDNLKLPQKA